jgi:YD repeat-containing protein
VADVPTLANMITWLADPATLKAQVQRSDMAYDARGQLSTVKTYASVDANGVGVPATTSTTQYVYDQAGLLLKTIAGADTAVYTYDGLGRQVSSTLASGSALSQTTLTAYDDGNNKTSVTLANGLTTTSVFDKAGRLVSLVQSGPSAPNLGTTQYFYDAASQLAMTQDPTGVRSWRLYDEAGRQVADIDGTGSLTEYVYNASNQRTQSIAYANAVNTALLVDANGQPTRPTLASLRPMATTTDLKAWRVFDGAGQLVASIDAQGAVVRNWYDGAGHLVKTTQYATPVNATILATLSASPALGALGLVDNTANDRSTSYFYDADGLLRGTVDAEGW